MFRIGNGTEDRDGVSVKDLSVMCQDCFFSETIKEMDAQLFFQLLDLDRDRSLGISKGFRSF